MVTVAQARASIQTQRGLVASQRQQIQQRTQQLALTAAQVRQQTKQSIAQRQTEAQRLSDIRKRALAILNPIEKSLDEASREVSAIESQIRVQQEEQAAFNRALKAFQSDDPRAVIGLSGKEQEFFKQISAGKTTAVRLGIEKQIGELRERGLEPIFIDGELKGFQDLITKQSRTLEGVEPIVIGKKLVGFEDIALQLSRQLREPIPIRVAPPEIPPGVVRVAETNIEQLVRNIRESQPQLRFIKNVDLRNALQKAIPPGVPTVLGLGKFSESKFKQALSDPKGVFKFTPIQAERIGDITKEIVGGFVLGAGIGKVVTLIRGAGARLLPRTLTGNPKFQKSINAIGGLGAITLTGAAGLSVKRTFDQEGIDAAILQTIGLISFGAGFSVTGLKALPRAEAEFKQVTDLLKKAIPPGRRGETRFDELGRFLKKKKGGRFGELEQLDPEDIRKGREALAAIERRIALAKTPKEQAKILAELKKRLRTPQEKRNFENFILGLVEKEIIKLPKVEIIPRVEARVIPERPITVLVPKRKTPGRIREERRVATNKARNQRRIARSKLSLGEKFKLAQAGFVEVGLTSAQRVKQRQKERQKLVLKQRTETKTIQRGRQRLILRQRLASRLALRQLLRNSLKTGLKLRPRLKRFGVLPPPIPFPKKRVKKKVFKKIPFEISGKSFNVLVRRQGKFKKIASNLPENRAKRRLLKVLDTTLAASGRIIPSNKKPIKKDIKKINIPAATFRRPVPKSPLRKKNTFTIIERRSKRLNTRTEVKAIQRAKKLKKIPMNLKVK
ncbi:hypothetical protein LCGC14_0546210 [marine sediment metagenome]|uniref:Uncharacterized protein n=1 Tax=marine sediment metagenome TaxID=412755 RepID=A0A0F9UCU0_9ZZZZ